VDEEVSLVKVTLLDEVGEPADDALAEPLGHNQFRLVESGWLSPSGFGDIVEAERQANGLWMVQRTVRKGRFRVLCGMAGKDFMGSPEFRAFASALLEAGGQWQLDFGGALRLHFPLHLGQPLIEQWERISRADTAHAGEDNS
jgi:hypothetical protein